MAGRFKSRRTKRKEISELTLQEQNEKLKKMGVVQNSFWSLGHKIIKECLNQVHTDKKSYVYGVVEVLDVENPDSQSVNVMMAKENVIAKHGGIEEVPVDEIVAIPGAYFLRGSAFQVASFLQTGETESQKQVQI